MGVPMSLSTETIEGSALSLEGVDYIEGGDSLALGVLGVGDRVADDVCQHTFNVSTATISQQRF